MTFGFGDQHSIQLSYGRRGGECSAFAGFLEIPFATCTIAQPCVQFFRRDYSAVFIHLQVCEVSVSSLRV